MDTLTVKVTQLGTNPSGVNGCKLNQNVIYNLRHKDRVELLLDKYVHEVIFNPIPKDDTKLYEVNEVRAKRKSAETLENGCIKQQKLHIQKENVWEEIDNKNLYIFSSKGVESREKVSQIFNFNSVVIFSFCKLI